MRSEVELGEGRRATFQTFGTGEPALLFEGGPALGVSLILEAAGLLGDVLTSYVIDPPGTSGSTAPSDAAGYSPEGHARFYEEVRAALGLGAVTLLGHSFGAAVALGYASMFPDATPRCIAVSPFVVGTEVDASEDGAAAAETEAMLARHSEQPWYPEARAVWDEWTERVLTTDDPDEVAEMLGLVMPLYTAAPSRPDVVARLEAAARNAEVDLRGSKIWEQGLYQGIDLRPHLKRISSRTLVIAGADDVMGGRIQAHHVAESVADCTVVLVENCGHMIAAEAPDAFRDAVIAWL